MLPFFIRPACIINGRFVTKPNKKSRNFFLCSSIMRSPFPTSLVDRFVLCLTRQKLDITIRAMGVPVMICHLAECLMDRTLDCRWDNASNDELFKLAALKQGVIKLGYVGELRPLNFLSETVSILIKSFLVDHDLHFFVPFHLSVYMCLSYRWGER